MKRKLLFLLRCLIFALILLTILSSLNRILEPKYYLKDRSWPATPVYRGFYEMEPDSVDVLILGSSVSMNNLAPQKLYDDYGIRSCNLSCEQQNALVSYYWLKEALRWQTPKLVIFEPLFLQEMHPDYAVNSSTRLTTIPLLAMRWSSVKLEAIRDVCARDPAQHVMNYFFTNKLYHDRWNNLTASDFVYNETLAPRLFGWAPGKEEPSKQSPVFRRDDGAELYALRPDMVEYLGRMVELCRACGIRFVMLKFPQRIINVEGIDRAYRQLAEEYGIDYYNFGEEELYQRLNADLTRDRVDNHGNILGNLKNTALAGALLSEVYGLGPTEDAQYEKARGAFWKICGAQVLPGTEDLDEYLRQLSQSDYVILMAVRDDAAGKMKSSTKALLRELGLQTEWSRAAMFRHGYAAVIADGRILEKAAPSIEDEALTVTGNFSHMQHLFSVTSAGYNNTGGPGCAIVIDGKDYAVNKRGLNIVVYDPATSQLVDSVCFDIYSGGVCHR